MIEISTIVRYCDNPLRMKEFYELFGLVFKEENHDGKEHYAAVVGDLVLELYPRPKDNEGYNQMFGFKTENIEDIKEILNLNRIVFIDGPLLRVRDPEGGMLLIEE